MLDPRTLEAQRDLILESCRKRGVEVDIDAAIAHQKRVAELQTERNELNRQRNEHQKSAKQKLSDAEREAHGSEGRKLKQQTSDLEERLKRVQSELDSALTELPNLIHPEVPAGGEENFRVLHEHGERPHFDFAAEDHLAIAQRLDLVDFERGATVAGQKFYFLRNEAALLDLALQRFSAEVLINEGFTPIVTPDLARPEIVDGCGFNPRGDETNIYSLANAELCLIGTSEIPLAGMYADSVIDEADLPIKLAGLSHCFRTEAGAHGRESRGLYRVHQFTKTEMFVFTRPEDSEAMHGELLRIEEQIFQALELPYRVIDVAGGDLGAPAYRKFDIEAWMPGRGKDGDWGEVTSASNCTDYQARRLRIRFRRKDEKRNEIVHTLNGTAVSNARAILTLLEIHQRSDGSVAVPEALRPHLGRDQIGPR